MSNPTISFRVSKFHLARALHIIRQLEPNYQIVSPAHIVKACFFDYIAKMNLSRSADVPPEIIIELDNFLSNQDKSKKTISLNDIIELDQQKEDLSKQSTINSVDDFSPPKEWKDLK